MRKPITRMQHGIADWLLVPVLAALPYLVGFADVAPARSVAWITAFVVLAATACTRAEWGLIRIFPFRLHLLADAGLGALLVASPVLFNFTGNTAARNTFVILGFGLISAATLLSQTDEMPVTPETPPSPLSV